MGRGPAGGRASDAAIVALHVLGGLIVAVVSLCLRISVQWLLGGVARRWFPFSNAPFSLFNFNFSKKKVEVEVGLGVCWTYYLVVAAVASVRLLSTYLANFE